jgi:hypothetical protein
MKTLVVYVFHQLNKRVTYFIKNAIFKDENIDFSIVCNNKDITFNYPDYVDVFYRNNKGMDFGAWSEYLLKDSKYKKYDNFIFVNSSVIGPFLKDKVKWTDIFLNGLRNNIKLFGSTINCIENPNSCHVQSYIFSMDLKTLKYLISCDIFCLNYENDKLKVVNNKEIRMSRLILDKGWNIGCLLKHYKNVDFTFKNKKPFNFPTGFFKNDLMNKNCYLKFWNEYDLVFVKGNRVNILN